jgi:ABC-type dipeptide/oligopeptide/nickel transport system permease component
VTKYIARRVGQGLITILFLSVIVFLMSRVSGDPLNLMLPIDAPPEMRERMEQRLGLDQPLPVQFGRYLGDLLQGDFGTSIRHREPVAQMYLERFPNSMRLIVPAFVLAWIIGVPLAVVAASTRFRSLRRALTIFSTVGMATPLFWLGIVLILVFSVRLGWLPASRMGGIDHHILPVSAMALFLLAGIMRLVRSSMLDSMGSEFIKLARLKGVPERSVIWSHALRNSLTAGITFLGVYFSVLITGSIVIEKVFAWPGNGRLLYDGIIARDYPVVQGVILMSALLIVLVNLAVDILQAYLDPRVRL